MFFAGKKHIVPYRVKPCRREDCASASTRQKCTYYHDPAFFPGSHDVRNFICNSWMYCPPLATAAPYGSRRLGAGQYLAQDCDSLREPELELFRSQTFHDMLCLMIVNG